MVMMVISITFKGGKARSEGVGIFASHSIKENVHPGKLIWNLKMMVFNRNLLFQGFIFRFHVSFRWCISKTRVLQTDGVVWYHEDPVIPSSHSAGGSKTRKLPAIHENWETPAEQTVPFHRQQQKKQITTIHLGMHNTVCSCENVYHVYICQCKYSYCIWDSNNYIYKPKHL